MRSAVISRRTAETDIYLSLELDGSGVCEIDSGVGFFDHMLTLFAKHSRFNLVLRCKGDTYVDDHHTVEDVGICLGQAFAQAIGDMAGICRYGGLLLPMDEALILSAADISGRSHLALSLGKLNQRVGNFDTELVSEFFISFVRNAKITLHIKRLAGENSHHIIEGAFKAFARTLRRAVQIDPALGGEIPSSKGVL